MRTAPVVLCLRRRNGPRPLVDQGLLFLAAPSSSLSACPGGTNFIIFALISYTTVSSSSPGPPSVRVICSCGFSESSPSAPGAPWLASGPVADVFSRSAVGSGVPEAGVVARLDAPPKLKGELVPVVDAPAPGGCRLPNTEPPGWVGLGANMLSAWLGG
ncbi:hypothetical protein BN1723_005734 [Verticillium longisporum]|uniref:Uncharacterized protein n=1 Tax=Verticillium longisporum TaxID=100787 RepID=A0A0G4NAS1_VERLO|nr:hypothetical protein BN1723_005734 [Verticillium longisporum]